MCWVIYRATNDPSVFTITEKAPAMAFSWLKAPTSDFTFKAQVKVLVGAFNQKKALVGAFFVIVKTDGSFAALVEYPACVTAWRTHLYSCQLQTNSVRKQKRRAIYVCKVETCST